MSKSEELNTRRYKRTKIWLENCGLDNTAVWIEGGHLKSLPQLEGFAQVGGAICTNTGVTFSKKALLKIALSMPDGAVMKVAGCNRLDVDDAIKEFRQDNKKEYIGNNTWQG